MLHPYYIKQFLPNSFLNWDTIEQIIKTSNPEFVEVIDENGNKHKYKDTDKRNSILISDCWNKCPAFEHILRFLCIRDNLNFKKWDVHIYASLTGGRSFPMHIDPSANYIIQCKGKCRWIIQDKFDIVLEEGDLIYIPPKWPHECKPLGERISISIPQWQK